MSDTTTKQIHLTLTGEFDRMLSELAEHFNISKTAVVRMAVKALYDRHFPKQQQDKPA